jgi:hypothetical protein
MTAGSGCLYDDDRRLEDPVCASHQQRPDDPLRSGGHRQRSPAKIVGAAGVSLLWGHPDRGPHAAPSLTVCLGCHVSPWEATIDKDLKRPCSLKTDSLPFQIDSPFGDRRGGMSTSIYSEEFVLEPASILLIGNLVLQLPFIDPCTESRWMRGTEPCQSLVIRLALRLSEHDWEQRLIEERAAQQDGGPAIGVRAATAFCFRCPVLIPLGTARSVPDRYKYEITQ